MLFRSNSAGTGGWHVGENANPNSVKVLKEKGYEINHRAKQFKKEWFDEFDLILVMDHENKNDLIRNASPSNVEKIKFFREFDESDNELVVPDPYYEPIDAFYEVLEMLEKASDALVSKIKNAQ